MTGKFFGIGVGPGAPDLITVRAREILARVPVVCTPRAHAEKEPVALRVVRSFLHPAAEVLEVATPMTRERHILQEKWRQGAQMIVQRLQQGQDVAFITLGDAMLFSTYTYLLQQVRQLLPAVTVESVPGITSFAAAAAYLNMPLAEGEEGLAVIPALQDPADLPDILARFPNVVLMKVAGRYDEIVATLTAAGLDERAVCVSRLGYADQAVTYRLQNWCGRKLDYLSLIIVKRGGMP